MKSLNRTYPLWSLENTRFFLTFSLTVILVYLFPRMGIPQIVNRASFLVILLVVFRSQDDPFWLAWFFLITNSPGRLFTSTSSLTLFRLPYFNILPGISLGFQELFLFMYLIKYLNIRQKSPYLFRNYIKAILIYGAMVFIYSLVLGMSSSNIVLTIRTIMPWSWALIIPAFIKDTEKLDRVFQLLFPFVILAFVLTIEAQLTGLYLHDILSGENSFGYIGDVKSELVRVSHAANILFICLVQSLLYISVRKKQFNENYLNLIVVIVVTSIFLSATRGWILGLLVVTASVLFMGGFNLFKQSLRLFVVMGVFFVIVINTFSGFLYQSSEAYTRVLSMTQLIQGDNTAGGTLIRVTERAPLVMSYFRESPIIGWGFSNYYYSHGDGHVGNPNMLLNGGVVGYVIWMLIFFLICSKILAISRLPRVRSKIGNSGLVFLFGMLATFVIHSSSGQMWGFTGSVNHSNHLHWAFLLTAASNYLISAYNEHTRNSIGQSQD